jgi:tetratricopeptide (TPR) repeat protein
MGDGTWRPLLPHLSGVHETYGQLLMELGRPDDALDHLRTALQFTERAIEQDPSLRSRHHDIGASHDAIAEVLRQQGRPEEALASSRQAEQAFREGLRSLPQDRNLRHALGCNMEKRALIVAALGDRENGVVHLRESLGMHRANLEANHTDRQAMSALASTISNLGSFAFSRGRPREIEELCADLAPWTLTLLASNPTDPDAVEACAELARWRGWALSDLGKPEEALAVAEQAMTAIDALPAASRSPDLARVWTYLGEIRGMSLRNLRRYDAAIALERDIVKRREGFVAESHDATSSHFLLVGLDNLRRSLAAAKLGDELLATDERRVALADSFVAAHATSHELRADLVSALIDAGQTRLDHGVDRTGAEAHWQRALRLLEDMLEERDDARLLASFEALLSRLRALEGK